MVGVGIKMRLDSHIHTDRSLDGINAPSTILAYARRQARLDAVAFTDHNVAFPRREAESLTREYGILVVPGIEVGDIRSGKHIVALNLDEAAAAALPRLKDPHEIIHRVSAEGGISIAAHPLRRGYRRFSEMGFDAVEVSNGGCRHRCTQVHNPGRLPEIGCSDSHLLHHIGCVWTDVQGVVPEEFGERTASGTIRRFTEELIESIRRGCCRPEGEAARDARYLDYGWLIGKKFVWSSVNAIRSFVS